MDFINPARLMEEIKAASTKKAALSTRALLLKGLLSGALLAYATSLAFKASEDFTTGAAALISGAVFPVDFDPLRCHSHNVTTIIRSCEISR